MDEYISAAAPHETKSVAVAEHRRKSILQQRIDREGVYKRKDDDDDDDEEHDGDGGWTAVHAIEGGGAEQGEDSEIV